MYPNDVSADRAVSDLIADVGVGEVATESKPLQLRHWVEQFRTVLFRSEPWLWSTPTGRHTSRDTDTMMTEIESRLESAFERARVEAQLHDVPPHVVYEVVVDGQRGVYKASTGPTGSAGVEGHVLQFLGNRTTVPVPEILLAERDYFVAAWHADAPSLDGEFIADERWARAAGRGLANLHEESAMHVDEYGSFRVDDGGRSSGTLTLCGHDDWHSAALEYVRSHRPVLERYGHSDMADLVVDVLEGLPDAFSGTGGPVCCHGWATPEHVSVVDGRVSCLVDFEHAIAAPGEFDVWRTVFPAFDSPDSAAARAFLDGYESLRPLPGGFEKRRPLYGLLNGIYYFESLYVQDQHDAAQTAEKAASLRDSIERIASEIG